MFENGMNNMNSFDDTVSAVLTEYRDALSQSDADAIASLYTPDGVLMPQNSPSSAGINAIRAACAGMLEAIGLETSFKIAEARQVAPEWGFARTNSIGTITIRATGGGVPEANQELILFQKVGEAWTIARYSFSTVLPLQA